MDIAALKAAAEVASPGPWKYEGSIYEHMGASIRAVPDDRGIAQLWQHGNVVADAAFIALANPASILSLIARLERAEGALHGLIDPLGPEGYLPFPGKLATDRARAALEPVQS